MSKPITVREACEILSVSFVASAPPNYSRIAMQNIARLIRAQQRRIRELEKENTTKAAKPISGFKCVKVREDLWNYRGYNITGCPIAKYGIPCENGNGYWYIAPTLEDIKKHIDAVELKAAKPQKETTK